MSKVLAARIMPEPDEVKTAENILKRKKCPDFREAMDNRELVGEMRYAGGKSLDGSFLTKRECDDAMLRLLGKFVAFMWTKNIEYLIDIAVYAELVYGNSMYNFRAADQDNPEDQKLREESSMAALEGLLTMVRYPNE